MPALNFERNIIREAWTMMPAKYYHFAGILLPFWDITVLFFSIFPFHKMLRIPSEAILPRRTRYRVRYSLLFLLRAVSPLSDSRAKRTRKRTRKLPARGKMETRRAPRNVCRLPMHARHVYTRKAIFALARMFFWSAIPEWRETLLAVYASNATGPISNLENFTWAEASANYSKQ